MGDTSARKEIEETSQNASITKETAAHLEQTLLRFREELEQVRNLESLSITLAAADANNQNHTIPPPAQPAHTQACNTCNNTPLLIPEPQNTTNDQNTPIFVDIVPHYAQPISDTPESDSKDSLIQNLAAELKRLTSRVQGVEDNKGVEGLNYEYLCVQPDVELPEGYKPPKFEMFDGTGDPRVHLRMYYDKLVGVGRDDKIRMKLFMRSLKGDALSWFNTENAPDVFYIQNLKKKPTETFCKYATRWRLEAAMVRPALEEEQMNRFFVRAQDPQYYERLMLIEGQKFSDIIKLGERIEEGIKNAVTAENPSQWINPNKTSAYHFGMKGHTIDECRSLKDKIQNLIDNKIIIAKDPAPNVRNNPLPDHKGRGIHMIEIEDDWDPKGSIGLIAEGDEPHKPAVTLIPIVVQIQPSKEDVVNVSVPLEFEAPPAKVPKLIEVEFGIPKAPAPFEVAMLPPRVSIPVSMTDMTPFKSKAIPWDYTAEARKKGKTHTGEAVAAQGMTRTGRILSEAYVPSNITGGEMANMVGQVLESHKITFHEDALPPEELSHNKALHITVQCEDHFITRILVDGGSSLNICPLITLRTLGKGLHEVKHGAISVKAFDGSQSVALTYLDDEPTTVTCNEAIQQTDIDSEEDDILEEVVREVENFENRPKSNLDETEVVNLGDTENVKETHISAHLSPSEKKEYTEFLKECEDIFAWSYDDMTGLSTSIVAHKLPTDPTCRPVKQKLRKFNPDMSLRIKEEVTKQVKARVLMVVEYPT
ncbi:uncharacterized protein [Nicotiana sylvestris]|uniref:uncharacterized protein n=1 Tax=Nicotiana sylvestris TaxID=4096 RepID=UPI00388CDC99